MNKEIRDGEYTPEVGDVVVFPQASFKPNRERPYTVTNVQDNVVAFRVTSGNDKFDYSAALEVLRELGMRKAG